MIFKDNRFFARQIAESLHQAQPELPAKWVEWDGWYDAAVIVRDCFPVEFCKEFDIILIHGINYFNKREHNDTQT